MLIDVLVDLLLVSTLVFMLTYPVIRVYVAYKNDPLT
ncbi:hypothetical protein Pan241w_53340 [Gimesia alba]|uniref:Uncharacterized protein n=1 Tax=Gimesia alba TaxID=2527973 RepID=A0A517RMV8_9PLAN|nr:hypothetical protein Pan241w_53340 [Gimesia alba]